MYMDCGQFDRTLQIDLIDNWHPRWQEVLDAIDEIGERASLDIDPDGWLSARHNLLVAFTEQGIAGHLSFRVQPIRAHAGNAAIEARIESLAVQPGFEKDEVEALLRDAAQKHARTLSCLRLVGLESQN
jgi:hypothetical protein